MSDFTERFADLHAQLCRLMLDVETLYIEAVAASIVVDSFDTAWEELQKMKDAGMDF